MLNRYPLWKNLMVIFLVAIGILYALPNLYGEDPYKSQELVARKLIPAC